MNDDALLYIERAENEFVASQILFDVSSDNALQKEQFRLEKEFTFYSIVIAHCYYCIFYSAKAALALEGIKTDAPEVHKKTIDAFDKYLVKTGKLDFELLRIYEKMIVRADELLGIIIKEKNKRGNFTYRKLPQANIEPARESLESAQLFFKSMNRIVRC